MTNPQSFVLILLLVTGIAGVLLGWMLAKLFVGLERVDGKQFPRKGSDKRGRYSGKRHTKRNTRNSPRFTIDQMGATRRVVTEEIKEKQEFELLLSEIGHELERVYPAEKQSGRK